MMRLFEVRYRVANHLKRREVHASSHRQAALEAAYMNHPGEVLYAETLAPVMSVGRVPGGARRFRVKMARGDSVGIYHVREIVTV